MREVTEYITVASMPNCRTRLKLKAKRNHLEHLTCAGLAHKNEISLKKKIHTPQKEVGGYQLES